MLKYKVKPFEYVHILKIEHINYRFKNVKSPASIKVIKFCLTLQHHFDRSTRHLKLICFESMVHVNISYLARPLS